MPICFVKRPLRPAVSGRLPCMVLDFRWTEGDDWAAFIRVGGLLHFERVWAYSRRHHHFHIQGRGQRIRQKS